MSTADPAGSELRKHLTESVRVLQIVVAAFVGSCAALTMVAATVLPVREGGAPRQGPQALAYVALGGVVAALVLSTVVSHVIVASGRRRLASPGSSTARPDRRIPWQQAEFQARYGEQSRLSGIYVTRTIVTAAILEGAAYLGLGAFYVTRNPLSLGATIAALAAIALTFPTLSRLENWIASQQRLLEEEVSFQRRSVSL